MATALMSANPNLKVIVAICTPGTPGAAISAAATGTMPCQASYIAGRTRSFIAASSKVDMPFVMTMQMVRFLVVMATGPALARFLAGKTEC